MPDGFGKVTGALGCSCWLAVAPLHEAVGDLVAQTGSYSLGMTLAGFAPLLGVGALVLFWGQEPSRRPPAKELAVDTEREPAPADGVQAAMPSTGG